MKGAIYYINHQTAVDFLLPKHYSGRIPSISIAFGWYDYEMKYAVDLFGNKVSTGLPSIDHLKAVCTFGKPASPYICMGVCGEEYSENVYELNRLCRVDDWHEPLSSFVGACLRSIRDKNWIVVSYADSGMSHNGYIYQATNFIYTGKTKERTDKYTEGNKHSRHYSNDEQNGLRKFRTAKHRYIYFCTIDKKLKKKWMQALNYGIEPYPKEENKNYVLGEYQEPQIINPGATT